MAKFKLRSELITPLTNAGIIDGDGNMKYRITYKTNRITGETMHEVVFNPATHTLQTNNEFAASVLRNRKSPSIKKDGTYIVDGGGTPWFTELDDSDTDPTVVIHTDGTEVITKKEKRVINNYIRHSGDNTIPNQRDKATMAAHLATAKNYFDNL